MSQFLVNEWIKVRKRGNWAKVLSVRRWDEDGSCPACYCLPSPGELAWEFTTTSSVVIGKMKS